MVQKSANGTSHNDEISKQETGDSDAEHQGSADSAAAVGSADFDGVRGRGCRGAWRNHGAVSNGACWGGADGSDSSSNRTGRQSYDQGRGVGGAVRRGRGLRSRGGDC